MGRPSDGCTVATLNFEGKPNSLAEVRIALDEADKVKEFILDVVGWGTRIPARAFGARSFLPE